MTIPKIHHYIPQFLLRRFVVGARRQLHAVDTATGRTFVSAIRTLAAENGFYDASDEISAAFLAHMRATSTDPLIHALTPATLRLSSEDAFAELEGRVAPVHAALCDGASVASLTDKERATLDYFVVVQFLRTPAARADAARLHMDLRETIAQAACTRGQDPAAVLDAMGANDGRATDAAHAMSDALRDPMPLVLALQENKDCLIVEAPAGSRFVLGDHPVTRISHRPAAEQAVRGCLGLRSRGVEITLPLSAHRTVLYRCRSVGDALLRTAGHGILGSRLLTPLDGVARTRGKRQTAWAHAISTAASLSLTPEEVIILNERQLDAAHRYVYGSTPADAAWIQATLAARRATDPRTIALANGILL
jgi:hypothetical protein